MLFLYSGRRARLCLKNRQRHGTRLRMRLGDGRGRCWTRKRLIDSKNRRRQEQEEAQQPKRNGNKTTKNMNINKKRRTRLLHLLARSSLTLMVLDLKQNSQLVSRSRPPEHMWMEMINRERVTQSFFQRKRWKNNNRMLRRSYKKEDKNWMVWFKEIEEERI